jgi:predicted nucleotidyltransferase
MNVTEAFEKFQRRLQITTTEQEDASRRHREVRDVLAAKLDVTHDFLTGSYGRNTKTKPLHDVDVFVELGDVTEADDPNDVLKRVEDVLVDKYGSSRVKTDRPAVRVDFGPENTTADDKVMSIEVVPAIAKSGHYRIADPAETGWMSTDPSIHADLATKANKAFSDEWKPLVKMLKKWNDHHAEPVVPSFLVEVMALELIHGDWTGAFPRELRAFFASAAERIDEEWTDPAGLGSPVSDQLHVDPLLVEQARAALRDAERQCGEAIRLDRDGRTGAALDVWQDLFGPLFVKS